MSDSRFRENDNISNVSLNLIEGLACNDVVLHLWNLASLRIQMSGQVGHDTVGA